MQPALNSDKQYEWIWSALDSMGSTLSHSLYRSRRLKSDKSKPSVLISLHLVTGHVHVQHIPKLRHVFLQARHMQDEQLFAQPQQGAKSDHSAANGLHCKGFQNKA